MTLLKSQTNTTASSRQRPNSRKSLPGFVNIGTTLLLVVFLVLTMVVFALLTLSGARNDLEFSRNLAAQKAEYYNACNRSEEILAAVDETCRRSALTGVSPDYGSLPVKVRDREVSWSVPIGEGRSLEAAYSEQTHQIIRWKALTVSPWNGDQTNQVPQGR